MKILFLIRSLDIGGAERQLVILAKSLFQRGHDISVTCFYTGGSLESELLETRIPLIDLQKGSRWNLVPFFIRLIKLIHTTKPDAIYGFLATANILTIILKPFFPHIKILWGVRASNMDLSRYDWLTVLSYRLESWLAKLADKIICNSYAGLEYAAKNGFPLAKMQVIQNGIDINYFKPDINARMQIRKAWEIADNDILIGLVARLDPMKDHANFLHAAAKLGNENNSMRFVCVGNGAEPYKARLLQLATDLKLNEKLIWAGERTDVVAVFNALDIAVSSSSYGEGFSNAIAEAMSCGVPCVVTEIGDSAMIVAGCGVVVAPSSAEALYQGFKLMLQKLTPDLKTASRERIVNLYSNEVMVTATELALQQLIENNCA